MSSTKKDDKHNLKNKIFPLKSPNVKNVLPS